MTDKFTPLPIEKLVHWILTEEKTGFIFGIPTDLFFVPEPADAFKTSRCGRNLETPIGVAAGPHTQLSQNIISAWLTGARFFELKTVQILDDLDVTKPCIEMRDEGYNCEWSQELSLEQSYHEYLNAWIVLHLMRHRLGSLPDLRQPGFVFNMSVGYNLEGILNPKVQQFLDNMQDCRAEKSEKVRILTGLVPEIAELDIPDCICDQITVSTMHGCPPDEIEKIGRYFIEERRLHTTIKLNPTLLGPEAVRHILNRGLGFPVTVPDEAFGHDLKYDDAIELIGNLTRSAQKAGVHFGLKLTNTLETQNDGVLPESESMIYMSGRALHPISINLAAKLQQHFEGQLDISFSAGVDAFNINRLIACGLTPVTVCSDLLKPGGYGRLKQYTEQIRQAFRSLQASSVEDYVRRTGGETDSKKAALVNLSDYVDKVLLNAAYHKDLYPGQTIRSDRKLDSFDCIHAPCMESCPARQNIPGYLQATANGDFQEAYRIILETNPFPTVQGLVCHHPCSYKCTRINLDAPLLIKEIKHFIASRDLETPTPVTSTGNKLKVGIIGAGPTGLTCAYFLAIRGMDVDVFESKDTPGGMAAGAIPPFRLDHNSLQRDITKIVSLGVRIHTRTTVDRDSFADLRNQFNAVVIATGAPKAKKLGIPGEDTTGVSDQLTFLARYRTGTAQEIGNQVIVIGGGNSAIDAARTAKRIVGPKGRVTVVYRRTQNEMPAEREEVRAAVSENSEINELTAPVRIIVDNGRMLGVECEKLRLGSPDDSGRPRPVQTGEPTFRLTADTVIPAIGQEINLEFVPGGSLSVNPETLETQLGSVFAGGDAIRGASTLIDAIADGRRIAENIVKYKSRVKVSDTGINNVSQSLSQHLTRLANRSFGPDMSSADSRSPMEPGLRPVIPGEQQAREESARCLQCDRICSVCTTVCPNRANMTYTIKSVELPLQTVVRISEEFGVRTQGMKKIGQSYQVLNLVDFCNECGNCSTFCPTGGDPYRDKPRFCLDLSTFENDDNLYHIDRTGIRAKFGGYMATIGPSDGGLFYRDDWVEAVIDPQTFGASKARLLPGAGESADLTRAAEMALFWISLKDSLISKVSNGNRTFG